jgi:hypothetical protein
MVLIERSVRTPRSPNIAARSLAGPTSRRPCRHANLEEVSNHQCLVSEDAQQGLEKVRRMKKSSIVVETINDEAGEITSILNVWSVEISRYLA